MQIERVLAEIQCVLRPGGRAIICTSAYAANLRRCLVRFTKEKLYKRLARDIMCALGAAAYPVCGRLLLRQHDPVFLPHSIMRNRLDRAGLMMNDDETCIGGANDEVVYVGYKKKYS